MVVSKIQDLKEKDLKGSRVAVGFRPSGSLHSGNLLTIGYAAVLADELDLELDLMVCDTDWSAHIHENHLPDENRVMKLFFRRDCPCETEDSQKRSFSEKTSSEVFDNHDSVAEDRVDEISEFLDVLREETVDFDVKYLSEYESERYTEALENILNSMDEFDEVFGGRFRDRYRSPVAAVCSECGFSDAKGSAYSKDTGMLVSACHNPDCSTGFMETELSDSKKGVYYLLDPVRDLSRDVAVHVFGGDYRDAGKGQKTPKVEKVRKITELACGETPEYFVTPMIGDEEGKPLSKSLDTGKTVSEMDNLSELSRSLVEEVREMVYEEKEYVVESELV